MALRNKTDRTKKRKVNQLNLSECNAILSRLEDDKQDNSKYAGDVRAQQKSLGK